MNILDVVLVALAVLAAWAGWRQGLISGVLSFVGFIGVGTVTWSTLDKRVVVLEESRKAQELRDTGQDDRNRDQMTAIRETLTEIKQNVIALRDRQDRTKP